MKIVLVGAVLLLAVSSLLAQADLVESVMPDLPGVYLDALGFDSGQQGKCRLDVYMEVPYETLHFLRDGDVFRARYEMTADLYDSTDKVLDEKWWKETAETKRYDESTSHWAGKISQRTFLVPPGAYSVAVIIKDSESGKTARQKKKIVARDFSSGPVSLSDLMLLNFIDTTGGKVSLYPNVTGNVGELKKGAYVFFEMYHRPGVTAGHCQLYIRDIRDNIVLSDTFTVGFTGTAGAQTWRAMKTDQLPAGDYHLEVRVTPKGARTDSAASPLPAFSLRDMTIRWRGMPVSIIDLSKAIDQLQYVATHDEIDEMRDSPPEKKKELFAAFWKKRDPTPNTDRNELMDEYYSRVEYSNTHFGHYLEGWKTDMGMVYIIFGVPSNIERHPFEIDSKPYEIWTYYDQNREFVFIDATGFGDYRLQNPIWDLYRTRPR